MARKVITEADHQRARRNVLLWICLGIVLLLLGIVLYVLVGYLRINATPPPPPEAGLAGDASALYGSAPTIPLDTQLAQVEQAVREGRTGSFELGMRPADLQASLASRLKPYDVEGLKVYFGEGTLVLQGKAPVGDRRLWATARVVPRVEGGQLLLDIKDAQLGTQPMWSAVRAQLQRQIDKALSDSSPRQTGVWLDGVAVSPYGMTIQGHTQPTQSR